MNKKQKAANAAFINKVKSLTIGTGSKPESADEPKCPACGGGPEDHEIKVVSVGIGMAMVERRRKPKHDETHEEAFSA